MNLWRVSDNNPLRVIEPKAGIVIAIVNKEDRARLIATAPDGYALAQAVIDWGRSNSSNEFVVAEGRMQTLARALIAKADGKD